MNQALRAMRHCLAPVLAGAAIALAAPAFAQSRNLASGFTTLAHDAKVLLVPTDVELYSLTAGGIPEPRADWTDAAIQHIAHAMRERKARLGVGVVEPPRVEDDALAEVNALHAAVARAINLHHFGTGLLKLPTKEGRLDWSLGEAVSPLRDRTGADYALFSWMRDSYATSGRIAANIAYALVGALAGVVVSPAGGMQVGYASLVDLRTGQIVWFNRLARGYGDLREPGKAADSIDALLNSFPAVQ